MRVSSALAAAAGAALLASSGCGGAASAPGGDASVPKALATTTIWADITRSVGCDTLTEVDSIIPAGADPHTFEPSLRDRARAEDAAVIVANGLGLEASLVDLLDAAQSGGTVVVHAAEHVDVLEATAAHVHDHDDDDDDHDGDHDHDGTADPHVWLDPMRVAAALPAIADSLVAAGIDRATVDACVATYSEQLRALDRDITTMVARLPADDRLLVTNHHSLGYFADRYGFEIIGTVIPSTSSLATTSPAALDKLAADIAAAGVPVIFTDTEHSTLDAEALATRVGVDVVALRTDTLGDAGTDTATYLTWLRATASQIVDALS